MGNNKSKNKHKNMSETTTMISGQIEKLERKVESMEELLADARNSIEGIELRIAITDLNDEVAERLDSLVKTEMDGIGTENVDLLNSLIVQCKTIISGKEGYVSDMDAVRPFLNKCDEFTGAYKRFRSSGTEVFETMPPVASDMGHFRESVCHPDGDCVFVDDVHRVKVKGAMGQLASDIVIDGEVYRDVKWTAGRQFSMASKVDSVLDSVIASVEDMPAIDIDATSECACGQMLIAGFDLCVACCAKEAHEQLESDMASEERALLASKPRFIRPKREEAKPRRPQKAPPRARKPVKR